MKKFVSAVLALAMLLSLTACGGNAAPETEATQAAVSVEMSCEEVLNKIVELQPVEFIGGTMPVDLTDTSEDGVWNVKYFTGLDDASQITEACVYEPMMGSIAFSMVMVRVAPDAGSKTVAEAMKAGIDTRKWICVEANDLLVAGYADMVMLIMVDSNNGMTAQSFVDAFQTVMGSELSFVA